MLKSEFVKKIATHLACSETEADMYINAIIKNLKDLLLQGDELTLPGFGKFSVTHKPARLGRNPQNGQSIEISAKTIPMFKVGEALKLQVANALKPLS